MWIVIKNYMFIAVRQRSKLLPYVLENTPLIVFTSDSPLVLTASRFNGSCTWKFHAAINSVYKIIISALKSYQLITLIH